MSNLSSSFSSSERSSALYLPMSVVRSLIYCWSPLTRNSLKSSSNVAEMMFWTCSTGLLGGWRMVNLGQRLTALRRSLPGYRSTHTSGASSWEDLVACSGTSPDGLKRLTQSAAGSANTAITSPNKLGISCQLHSASAVDAGFL